jgi:hypothetical protein
VGKIQLIVGEKDKGFAIFDEFVPAALIRVAQANWYERNSPDFKVFRTHRFIVYAGLDIPVSYGKVGWRHDFGEHCFNVFLGKRASLHPYVGLLKVKGFEKGKAHEVVPVSVRKDYIVCVASFFDQAVSEPSNSRARIHDDDVIIFASDLDARGIAAVFDVFSP